MPRWVLITGLVLIALVLGALLVNIIAINRLLVNEFIPGRQLCVTALQAHAINDHITIPKACARVGFRP